MPHGNTDRTKKSKLKPSELIPTTPIIVEKGRLIVVEIVINAPTTAKMEPKKANYNPSTRMVHVLVLVIIYPTKVVVVMGLGLKLWLMVGSVL